MRKQTTIVVIGSLRVKKKSTDDKNYLACKEKRNRYTFSWDNFKIVLSPFWKWIYSKRSISSTWEQILFVLNLVLLNPDIPCLSKQCRSRSVANWSGSMLFVISVQTCQSEWHSHCRYADIMQHFSNPVIATNEKIIICLVLSFTEEYMAWQSKEHDHLNKLSITFQ